MGIDGIGKRGVSPPPLSQRGGAAREPQASGPFEASRPPAKIDKPEVLETGRPLSTHPSGSIEGPSTALERLQAGAVDVNGYVDLKVNDATAHLSALPPSDLEAIRNALRTRMASDPTLVGLVRAAAGGATPELPPED